MMWAREWPACFREEARLEALDRRSVPGACRCDARRRNTIDLARLADQLGYERYWIAEHHATPGFASPAPEVLLARVGVETAGIRIGSGGVLLPHYSPLKVAETFRVLHALYPGRIDLGIGRAPVVPESLTAGTLFGSPSPLRPTPSRQGAGQLSCCRPQHTMAKSASR